MKTAENTKTAYGAPEMKKVYKTNLRRGLEIAVIIHAVFLFSYLALNMYNKVSADNNIKPPIIITLENIDIPPSVNEDVQKIEEVQDITKDVKDLTALTPDPVAREKADELTIKTQDQLDKINGNVSNNGDSVRYIGSTDGNNLNGNNDIKDKPDIIIKKPPVEDRNFNPVEVESMPECVNLEMVRASIKYPKVAIEANIEGKVTVKVLVGPEGNVIKIGSISGPEIFYDEVKEKAMNLQFTPGLQNGKAVKVWMNVPFNFRLKDK
jgi:TonB family protein